MLKQFIPFLKKTSSSHHRNKHAHEIEAIDHPKRLHGLPPRPTTMLLNHEEKLIKRIRQVVGTTPETFERIYRPLIDNYANFVHLLPASEAHHHRDAGGLLRHGLEVGLRSLQLAKEVLWSLNEPPGKRRELTLRWECAAFIAGLCHDLGKPVTDVYVLNEEGTTIWDPLMEGVGEWCEREQIERYYLQWRANRYKRHEILTVSMLYRVVPDATLRYVREVSYEVYEQLIEALSMPQEDETNDRHNELYDLMIKADQHSVERDLANPIRPESPGIQSIPAEREYMDMVRSFVRIGKWKWNVPGAKVWIIEDSVFLIWPKAGADLAKELRHQGINHLPKDTITIAEMLIDRQIAVPFKGEYKDGMTWPIQPRMLCEGKPEDEWPILWGLRIRPGTNVFADVPMATEAVIGHELLGIEPPNHADAIEDLAEDEHAEVNWNKNTATTKESAGGYAPDDASKIDEAREDQMETSEVEKPSKPTARWGRKKSPKKPSTATPEKAHSWLIGKGHVGAILSAMANDFRDGNRQWGVDGVRMDDGKIAIPHPQGWKGSGVAPGEMMKLLSQSDLIESNGDQAGLRKTEIVEGYAIKGGNLNSMILNREVSRYFMTIVEPVSHRKRAEAEEQVKEGHHQVSHPPAMTDNEKAEGTKAGRMDRNTKLGSPASAPNVSSERQDRTISHQEEAIRQLVHLALSDRRNYSSSQSAPGERTMLKTIAIRGLVSEIGLPESRAKNWLKSYESEKNPDLVILPMN